MSSKDAAKRPKPKQATEPRQPRQSRKTAVITGVTGQDGSYLAELLLGKGYEVIGVVRRTSHDSYERIGHLLDRVHIVPADLLDQHSSRPWCATRSRTRSTIWRPRASSPRRGRSRC